MALHSEISSEVYSVTGKTHPQNAKHSIQF